MQKLSNSRKRQRDTMRYSYLALLHSLSMVLVVSKNHASMPSRSRNRSVKGNSSSRFSSQRSSSSSSSLLATNNVLHSLFWQGNPTTPAAVLEPWRIVNDPHPYLSLEELEQTVSDREIDAILKQVVGTEPGIVMQRFRPYPRWLWRQWFGTVLFHTAGTALLNMGFALLFCIWMQYYTSLSSPASTASTSASTSGATAAAAEFFGKGIRSRLSSIFRILPRGSDNFTREAASAAAAAAATTTTASKSVIAFPTLDAIDKIWKTLMSLSTFLLTFFVGQAYTFWRAIYDQARGVQGRMNDINMLLAANGATMSTMSTSTTSSNVQENSPTNNNGLSDDESDYEIPGLQDQDQQFHQYDQDQQHQPQPQSPLQEQYTEGAIHFLQTIATKLRLCHLLFWATNTPRFRVLLTPRGLQKLVDVGYLPQSCKEQVIDATTGMPMEEKWYAMLESAVMDCHRALHNSAAASQDPYQTEPQQRQHQQHKQLQRYSTALELSLQDLFCRLRGHLATIPDLVDGRMPLAYAHFVQILVDLFLLVAPIAQYPEMGIFSVVSVGILTLFYRGLLDLAKVFLDPLDGEDYCEGAVFLDLAVFIREANAASVRWMTAGQFSTSAIPYNNCVYQQD